MLATRLTAYKMSLYCLVFYCLWSIRELIVRPVFLDSLQGVAFESAETLIKLLIWTFPALLLITHYEQDMWISLKEMTTNKVKWRNYLLILIIFILYFSLAAFFSFGKISIHPDFDPITLIGTVLFVGITEEIVFRAWILNALLDKMKRSNAVLLNAVLFTLIHYPYWIYLKHDGLTFLSGSVSVMILSLIFSWTFIKSRSIFPCIMLHMIWNLLVGLVWGS